MPRVLPYLVYIGLVVYALSDMLQRPEEDRRGFSRWAWAAGIVLLPYVGAIGWLLISRRRPTQPPPGRREPIAPDDDPEYLAWLREQSKRRRESGEGR